MPPTSRLVTTLAVSAASLGSAPVHANLLANGSFEDGASPVPEPGTWALLAAGLVSICTVARRRTRG